MGPAQPPHCGDRFPPPSAESHTFEAGQVAIDATIDCDAQLPGGEPAWDATATQTQQPAVALTTTRPWGTVSDTLPGWDIGWAILNGASGVCDLS